MKKRRRRRWPCFSVVLPLLAFAACAVPGPAPTKESRRYEASWNSLKTHETPRWFREAKFGIYTHWGVYSVPAYGPNGTWYPHNMYFNPDSPQYKYHEKTYGPATEFGYKDFIPMFKAENFNPDDWAELFQRAGARFAGPVAEHHDGFAMWDSQLTEWDAFEKGPRRDVVGELAEAIRKRDMKFVTAFHHAENWWFFPVWDQRYDTSDPLYSKLYGPGHEQNERPSKEFLDLWKGKLVEVVDRYQPDLIWFDFALDGIREDYRLDFFSYYFNKAEEWGKEVVVTYKGHDLPPGVGVMDLELGQMDTLTYHEWITDTSVDDQGAWSYVQNLKFKSVNRLVDNLVDRVSKNGYLLLNVGPKADGEIPEEARDRLLGIGDWLRVNGESIYGTTSWSMFGEGPTNIQSGQSFNERQPVSYTAEDIRFTVKDNVLYAIVLDWPGDQLVVRAFSTRYRPDGFRTPTKRILYEDEIESIRMLGIDQDLEWNLTEEGLVIETPEVKPCEHAFVFKITRTR